MKVKSWLLAIGASVGVHVALVVLLIGLLRLSATPPTSPPNPPSRPVEVVRVGVLTRPGAPATAPAPQPSTEHAPGPRPAPRANGPVPEPGMIGILTGAPVEPAAGPGDAPTPTEEPAGDGSGPASGIGRPGAPDGPAPAEPGAPGVAGSPTPPSPAVEAAVHERLRSAARACYPPSARRFRQRGSVRLSFCVGAQLVAEQVSATPSGLSLLDEAAEGCVAVRAAPFPDEARGRCFTVPVEFGGAE